MDRARAKALGERITDTLKASGIEEQESIKVSIGGGTIDPGGVRLRLEVREVRNGEAHNPHADDYERYAETFGLAPEWLGGTFTSRGTTYRIVGLHLNRPKYPVDVERVSDRKRFKFTAESVKIQEVTRA